MVAASTRPGDEARVIAAIPDGHGLLLAPRHPDRFDIVARTLHGMPWARRTALEDAVPDDVRVVLLDTLGELAGGLVGARAAYIGGTFDPAVGGHSPAEATRAGVPVVAGPHRWANPAAWRDAAHIVIDRYENAKGLAFLRANSLTRIWARMANCARRSTMSGSIWWAGPII